jgi:O-antigen/teichoic acid export membrane protein
MIPYFYTPYEQGNYIQAYKIVEYVGVAMSFTYYPFIALVAGSGQKMRDQLLMLVRLSNTVVFVFAAAIFATGHWLFPLLFGPSFDRMYHIFICFIPGVFAVCSSAFFTAWYFGTGQIRYNIISACILLLTMPALFFFLGGANSAEAAACGFSLANLLSLAYDIWIYQKTLPSPLSSMLLSGPGDLRVLVRLVKTGARQGG